jgi:acyl-CoA dehydrogenase
MDFGFSSEADALRARIKDVLAQDWVPGRRGYREPEAHLDYERHKQFRLQLGRHPFFGVGIPERYGGSGGGVELRYVVADEFAYHGLIYPKVAMNMVAPILLAHGTEDQRGQYLPRIARGEVEFAQAYSEPEAGSDLASLRTKGIVDGDELVINGNKLYTSFIHRCEYVVVAVRTDKDAPRHRGISLVIVPHGTPGLSYSPLWGMGDIRTNAVVLDDVRVPRANVIGSPNEGWAYLRTVLAFERLVSFGPGTLRPILDDLAAWLPQHPESPYYQDPELHARLANVEVGVRAMDALTRRVLWQIEQGHDVGAESAQVKVFGTELRRRLTALAMELLGSLAPLTAADPEAPLDGAIQRVDEASVMPTFGGGANEVLRDLIVHRVFGRVPFALHSDF